MAKSKSIYSKPKKIAYAETDSTKEKARFFICCEGEKTEVNYFKGLNKLYKNIDLHIKHVRHNTSKLIKWAVDQKNIIENKCQEKFDQCWVVFDKDDIKDNVFNASIEYAKKNDFYPCWSNEAFELWYLLHFSYVNTPISRKYYGDKLDKLLDKKYEKNDENIYNDLAERTDNALENASRLEDANKGKQPCECNPGTMVHKLVWQIRDEHDKCNKTIIT